jgi:hypothetical protein
MGGGRPPSDAPPTPGNDPMDSFSAPRGGVEASASSSVGPIRTPRSSPSPAPYGAGGDTPRPPRMSSASQAAARARAASERSHSPFPFSLGSPQGSPFDEDDHEAIVPDTPQTSGDGWTVSEFAEGLMDSATWLEKAVSDRSSAFLTGTEKALIHSRVATLLRAVNEAGVSSWGGNTSHPPPRPAPPRPGQLSELTMTSLMAGDFDVPMAGPPRPATRARQPRRGPLGSRPLPRPPVRAGGGSARARGAPPPVPDASTRPAVRPASFAQAARFQGGQVPSSSVDGIVRLAKAFPELPTSRLAAMQGQASPAKPRSKKASSTVHGPSRRQILVKASPIPDAFNPGDLLDQVRSKLALHRSRLVAQSVSLAYGGFSIATDVVASEDELRFVREGVRAALPGASSTATELPSSTSYLKLVDVPLTAGDKMITPEIIIQQIAKAGPLVRDHVVLQTPPRVVRDSPKSDTATVYLNVADSVSGARAKVLLRQSVQFGRYVAYFRTARANPGMALCNRCWRWGHPASACRAPQIKCPACMGPHRKDHHRTLAGCCKGNPGANPPVPPTLEGVPCPHPSRCPNCRKAHAADDRRCDFWRHRFDQDWIRARYSEVRERQRSRSPHANHPAAGGGRT